MCVMVERSRSRLPWFRASTLTGPCTYGCSVFSILICKGPSRKVMGMASGTGRPSRLQSYKIENPVDEQAFGRLYGQLQAPRLRFWLIRQVGVQNVDDFIQQSALIMLQMSEMECRALLNPIAYAVGVLRHLTCKWARNARALRSRSVDLSYDMAEEALDPEQQAEHEESLEILKACIANDDNVQRRELLTRHAAGESRESIMDAMGLNPSEYRNILYRGKASLIKRFASAALDKRLSELTI